jgi:hypothetical protein
MAKRINMQKITTPCLYLCRTAISLFCILLFVAPTSALCEPVTGSEYEVKLGFIYNFIRFVTWPDDAFKRESDTLTLCFASDNASSNVIYKLDGKTVKGRKLKVIAYQDEACLMQSHVLFFATQDRALIQNVLNETKGRSVLTVGEIDGFTLMGGMINFFKEHNNLRFQVNIDTVRRNALKMSSQLLGSAKIVREEPD